MAIKEGILGRWVRSKTDLEKVMECFAQHRYRNKYSTAIRLPGHLLQETPDRLASGYHLRLTAQRLQIACSLIGHFVSPPLRAPTLT